jgi:hypothetical protein
MTADPRSVRHRSDPPTGHPQHRVIYSAVRTLSGHYRKGRPGKSRYETVVGSTLRAPILDSHVEDITSMMESVLSLVCTRYPAQFMATIGGIRTWDGNARTHRFETELDRNSLFYQSRTNLEVEVGNHEGGLVVGVFRKMQA